MLRAASGAVSTTLGNSFVGWADRQARQRRFRRPLRADLLLALLATRLAAVAYVETEGELRAALNSPAIGTNMHGGLKLLHFRKQKSEQTTEGEGLHPQWFLCRGAQPWWTFKDGPRAGQSASHNTESDGGDGGGRDDGESTNEKPQQDALYLVFRGTWSATDVIRDLCVEPEQFGVSTSGCAPPTAPPSTRPCASTVCVRMRAPVYVCLCAWRSMHADMPPASYFPPPAPILLLLLRLRLAGAWALPQRISQRRQGGSGAAGRLAARHAQRSVQAPLHLRPFLGRLPCSLPGRGGFGAERG